MKIDDNPVEIEAMAAFRRGAGDEGHKLQNKFLDEFCESVKKGENFCSCPVDCKYHGKCTECVTVHRGHGDHLPYCMHDMLNRRLKKLSELSEHSIKIQI